MRSEQSRIGEEPLGCVARVRACERGRQRVGTFHNLRRIAFLRGEQELATAHPAARRRIGAPMRQRNREDQPDDHRRHPGKQ